MKKAFVLWNKALLKISFILKSKSRIEKTVIK